MRQFLRLRIADISFMKLDINNLAWALCQMERMSRYDSERIHAILSSLFERDNDLLIDLVIGAVDQEMLSIHEASRITELEHYEIERRLFEFRNAVAFGEVNIVRESKAGIAKIAERNIAVWEIVREFRKVGSVDRLRGSFPDLTKKELAVALRYAEAHSTEIEQQIDQYEAVIERRRSEYPFSE